MKLWKVSCVSSVDSEYLYHLNRLFYYDDETIVDKSVQCRIDSQVYRYRLQRLLQHTIIYSMYIVLCSNSFLSNYYTILLLHLSVSFVFLSPCILHHRDYSAYKRRVKVHIGKVPKKYLDLNVILCYDGNFPSLMYCVIVKFGTNIILLVLLFARQIFIWEFHGLSCL